ncbi:MAG: OB-fold domain-containing protein, partial [Bacteroidota bacterium]
MIAHLTGQLIHKAPTHIIVDVSGVGYEVRISLHTFSTLKTLDRCQLFTYYYIKGDVQALY